MAHHVRRPDFKPQVDALGGGGVEEHLQHVLAQFPQVHALHGLPIEAAGICPRERQQLVRQLRGAARGIAQFLDLRCS